MNEKTKNSKGKRPYQKPRVYQVELDSEEAVLTACKVSKLTENIEGMLRGGCNAICVNTGS